MVKKIINLILICLFLLLTGLTIYKLVIKHNDKLYNVLYSEIKYKAKRCFLEERCSDKILLNELYDKGYLTTMYDPISKEELDRALEINILEDKVEIKIN